MSGRDRTDFVMHLCHMRPECDVEVHPRLLFCAHHWAMVPTTLQQRIYGALKRWKHPGAPSREERRAAMMEWLAAVDEAKEIVRGKS